MAKILGSAFRAISAAGAALASGCVHDAGVRRFRNTFNLADANVGGTTNTPVVARLREHNALSACELSSTVSLAAVNFTLGTADDPDKYATAFAGPAAGATVRVPILPAMLAADAISAPEEIILTPSAALPANGLVVASVYASHR